MEKLLTLLLKESVPFQQIFAEELTWGVGVSPSLQLSL